jgi:hypothetical protein
MHDTGCTMNGCRVNDVVNPKSQALNPKQIQITKIQKRQTLVHSPQ